MKCAKYVSLLALVVVGLTLGAYAKDQNEGKFTLTETARVGSTQLKPGDYKVTWEGTGAEVQVKILQGKNVVATTSAKLISKSGGNDAVILGTGSDVKTIDELDFGKHAQALVFGSAETAQN